MKHYEDSVLLIQAIHKVIEWLESLLDEKHIQLKEPAVKSKRVFSQEECECLSVESRHYLLMLEQKGILTPNLRERIIHHAMLLDLKKIELPIVEGIARILLGKDCEMIDPLEHITKGKSSGIHTIH